MKVLDSIAGWTLLGCLVYVAVQMNASLMHMLTAEWAALQSFVVALLG